MEQVKIAGDCAKFLSQAGSIDSPAFDVTSAEMVYSLSRPVTILPGYKVDCPPPPCPSRTHHIENTAHEN
jgi:hypothetical protein